MSEPENTYCICPKCRDKDRRKLPAWCRVCGTPMIARMTAQGQALAPKKNNRGEPKTTGKRERHNATGDAVNAVTV